MANLASTRAAIAIGALAAFIGACTFGGADTPDASGAGGGDDAGAAGTPDAAPVAQSCEGRADIAGDTVETIDVDGRERSYRLHVPESYDPEVAVPLVLNFHGYTSNAFQQELYSGMSDKADAEGFIAVHPDGISSSWNGGSCCGAAQSMGVDDVGFVEALLDELEATLCVDTSRVYVTGMSNGGFMSHRLACDLTDRITAIAPVAGHDVTLSCEPSRPIPVMHFHGTTDNVVPYSGTGPTIDAWRERNGCIVDAPTVVEEGNTRCEHYLGCDDGVEVTLCTVTGLGHEWPGAFNNASDVDATELMWSFFEAYRR